MKILATLTVLFSLTVLHPAAPLLPQSTEATTRAAQPHGKWYLAENGHATEGLEAVLVLSHGTVSFASLERPLSFPRMSTADTE
jgi:hypothetical protein